MVQSICYFWLFIYFVNEWSLLKEKKMYTNIVYRFVTTGKKRYSLITQIIIHYYSFDPPCIVDLKEKTLVQSMIRHK